MLFILIRCNIGAYGVVVGDIHAVYRLVGYDKGFIGVALHIGKDLIYLYGFGTLTEGVEGAAKSRSCVDHRSAAG